MTPDSDESQLNSSHLSVGTCSNCPWWSNESDRKHSAHWGFCNGEGIIDFKSRDTFYIDGYDGALKTGADFYCAAWTPTKEGAEQ